jgi:type IV pilus assembly protein PilM
MAGIDDFLKKLNIEKVFSRFKRKEEFFGLDIGTKSVKLVQLKGRRLLSFGLEELSSPEPPDKATIIKAVRTIINEHKIRTNKVVVCVSGPSINVRYLRMPRMPEEELSEAIKWEAKKYITMDPREAIMDHLVLGEVMEEGVKKVEVVMAAAPRGLVQDRISFIQAAGLLPLAVDVAPFALWRSIQIKEKETAALVDIGAGISNINIVERGILHFSRDISLAGNNLTLAISKEMNLDFHQAERMKKEEGLSLERETPATKAMRGPLERLVVEIERSFHYFLAQALGRKIDRLILSGGSARLKGIDKYLNSSLGVPVEIAKPLADIEFDEEAFDRRHLEDLGPRMAVAIGLARREE